MTLTKAVMALTVLAAAGCGREYALYTQPVPACPRADISGFMPYMIMEPSIEVSLLMTVSTWSRSAVPGLGHDDGRGISVIFSESFPGAEAWIGSASYRTEGEPTASLFFVRGGMRLTEGYGPFYCYASVGIGLEWMSVDSVTYSTIVLEDMVGEAFPVSVYYRLGAGLNAGPVAFFLDFASSAAWVADRDLIESGFLATWTASAGVGARF